MTRDSRWWDVLMVCSVLTAISSRWDVMDALLPAVHADKAHAVIELLAVIATAVTARMRASPLRGRRPKAEYVKPRHIA